MKQTKFKVAILVDCSSGWGRRLIRGIANYSLKAGNWQLLVEEKSQNESLQLPQGWQGDGIIARVSNQKLYKELIATGKPVINISGIRLQGVDLPRVSTDYHAAALLAVQHFHERGFRNLAYCGESNLPHENRHCQAFIEAAEARALNCHVFNSQRLSSKHTWDAKRAELRHWLETLPKPVGVLTWGTQRGRDLLNICNEFNIPAPESVAVLAGDDDELLCEVCDPPMSGIITPAEEIGHEAARMLDTLLHGQPLTPDSKLFPPSDVDTRLSTDTLAIGDPALNSAIRFIRDNIRKPIQVSDIADAVQLSRRALERRFASALGHSPAREISNARLTLAKKLLRETRLSIADIAAKSGYSTPEYMVRVFQKDSGLSPVKYRAQFLVTSRSANDSSINKR
ncbi:MAG: substrate-binding domain-containing protein [Coraliomargarita sp.]